MPVQIIDGDLFQTHAKYICHQVNCQARMGSGETGSSQVSRSL